MKCRSCGSERIRQVLDLGKQHLADFRDDDKPSPKYPLVVVLCEKCKLVQLEDTTPQAEMYHERYGFKSSISDSIKADLDDIVTHAFQYINDPTSWLDIASNDGYLLSCVPTDIFRVGVDPVEFLCEEAIQHADMIINDYYSLDAVKDMPFFDVITSISCFYDMPDPSQFVSDVKNALKEDGVWVIQQNYLLTTLQLNAVDNICHEHLEYYSLLALENLLERHGLEVNEVTTSSINGGSFRTIVSRKGTFFVHKSVAKQREIELDYGLDTVEPYEDFNKRVTKQLEGLRRLVKKLNSEGEKVYILAASTRGGTIWQSAGLTKKDLPYAVERNPAKVGRIMSSIGSEIISEEQAHEDNPGYMVVSIWFFRDEIIKREAEYLKNGGHLIFPLPELEIV